MLTSRVHATALVALFSASPGLAQSISAELVAASFSKPLDLEAPAGDARLFVVEQTGRIRIVDGGSVLPAPFLDIGALIDSSTFTGLRGMVFHPDYASNGFFYVWYDENGAGQPDLVMARYTVSAADPETNRAPGASR